jgi:KipI family sensor histidine kinase inhibitor
MTAEVRVRPAGLSACLLDVPPSAVGGLAEYLRGCHDRGMLAGVVDVVPGASTVLLDGAGAADLAPVLGPLLAGWFGGAPDSTRPAELVEIPVTYDGPDLADVARQAGLSEADVVALHTRAPMTVAFCGFAPGFAYIADLPVPLRMPRLATPRTAVPAGSVAVAEEYTGIYPRTSPGGWRILGHTAAELWNLDREPPALLSPGTRVQFFVAP